MRSNSSTISFLTRTLILAAPLRFYGRHAGRWLYPLVGRLFYLTGRDGHGQRIRRMGSSRARVVSFLAESGRIPVDNPSSTFELSMIEASRTLEYSGQELALMEWGGAMRFFVLLTKPRHGWWVFRTFDDSGMCLLRGLFLGSLENSLA